MAGARGYGIATKMVLELLAARGRDGKGRTRGDWARALFIGYKSTSGAGYTCLLRC
jgi:hypothetical protein